MTEIAAIGLDIAKNWFQVHAADAEGQPVIRRKLRRYQVVKFFADLAPTVVGIEACSTSHHWARVIGAAGHRVRLLPPQYVKPFVKRSKTDTADAEAICEAMRRTGIRDVAIKTREQQAVLEVHRARDLLVRQRTMTTNAIRGFAAEFRIVVAKGGWHMSALRERLHAAAEDELPDAARDATTILFSHYDDLDRRVETLEKQIMAPCRRGQPPPGDDPGYRTAQRDPDCRDRSRHQSVPLWPGVCSLDRSGATRTLKRRQAEARRDLQTRQPLPQAPADRRRSRGCPLD